MKVYAPTYLKEFKCIADRCEHNCCIGWEIDIDDDTLNFYKNDNEIIKHIEFGETNHFILDDNERCPFLDNDNLCKIIKKYGESALCQICRDHPRFKNYYESRIEIGIGLTCPSACDLILKNDFRLEVIKEGEEIFEPDDEDFFLYRESILNSNIEKFKPCLPDFTLEKCAEILRGLERLDGAWDNILDTLKDNKTLLKAVDCGTKTAKRLFDYFVFRHLSNTSLEFCMFCTLFILSLNGDVFCNARMFSNEIEYSDENVEKLNQIL